MLGTRHVPPSPILSQFHMLLPPLDAKSDSVLHLARLGWRAHSQEYFLAQKRHSWKTGSTSHRKIKNKGCVKHTILWTDSCSSPAQTGSLAGLLTFLNACWTIQTTLDTPDCQAVTLCTEPALVLCVQGWEMPHSPSSKSAFPTDCIKESMLQSPSKEPFRKESGVHPPSRSWPHRKEHLCF